MTDKELKRLSRRELLEMLILQTRKCEMLEKKLEDSRQLLEKKELSLRDTGDLATAVMQLCGVFDAAKEAEDQYRINVRLMEEQCRKDCQRRLQEASAQAEEILSDARAKAEELQRKSQDPSPG